jgi:hypothetical protein
MAVKPFRRYEDTPVLVGQEGKEPVFVFANSASISVTQAIYAKKFTEDYRISFAGIREDLVIQPNREYEFLLGSLAGIGKKIPESIETIRKGTKISYPSKKSLLVNQDAFGGDYMIRVINTGEEEIVLDKDLDIPFGEVDIVREYSAERGAMGSLDITYYMNTGNIYSFFQVTGLVDTEVYPQISEERITGCLGDFKFTDAYIREISFSARPYEPIETNVSIDIYGNLEYEDGLSDRIINNDYYDYRVFQKSIPHALGSKIEGAENVGMEHPIDFSYTITVDREPTYEVPLSGNLDESGEVPVRVNKTSIDVTAEIIGEKLDPYLQITGQRAEIHVTLGDIGFSKDFTDNNIGEMREFRLVGNLTYPEPVSPELISYGVVDRDTISVSEGGYLRGRASIKQSYR